MTCLISKIDYFQVLFMVQSIFIRLGEGKKVTAILRRWSSRGLGTPKVNIASVTVPAFTAKKMASSKKKGELQPYRPEPSQIATDRSLKKTNIKYKTKGASNVKKVPLHT